MRVTKTVSDEVSEFYTPMLGPRGGGRGRGKPLPRGLGEEGTDYAGSSKPPTPRGLVGLSRREARYPFIQLYKNHVQNEQNNLELYFRFIDV